MHTRRSPFLKELQNRYFKITCIMWNIVLFLGCAQSQKPLILLSVVSSLEESHLFIEINVGNFGATSKNCSQSKDIFKSVVSWVING